MKFPADAYVLAVCGGFVATAATLPLWRAWCRRSGLVDDPGHRKIHREPVPLAGGLAVLTGLLVPLGGAAFLLASEWLAPASLRPLEYGWGRRGGQVREGRVRQGRELADGVAPRRARQKFQSRRGQRGAERRRERERQDDERRPNRT